MVSDKGQIFVENMHDLVYLQIKYIILMGERLKQLDDHMLPSNLFVKYAGKRRTSAHRVQCTLQPGNTLILF